MVVGKQKAGNQCTIVSTSDLSEAKEEKFAVPGYPGEDAISKEEKQPRTLHWSAYFKGVVALMNQAGNIPAFEAVISTCIPPGGGDCPVLLLLKWPHACLLKSCATEQVYLN